MIQVIERYKLNRYLRRGQYDRAVALLAPKARSGDAEAAFKIGLIYSDAWNNLGADDDFLSEKWFCKAAKNGHIQAQLLLGDLYAVDAHRPARLHRALSWYREANRNGSVEAGRKLASLYLKHRKLVDLDINAAGLLIEAAEHGDYKAAVMLGWGYKKGCMGLPPDFYRFQYWRSKLKRMVKPDQNYRQILSSH